MRAMRRVVLGLVAAFALLQFVTYTACACDSLCGHKNACERTEADDCCKHGAQPVPDAPCFHLEPQSDVDLAVSALDFPILATFQEILPVLPPLAPESQGIQPIGLSPPFRELPLYLEHLALLI